MLKYENGLFIYRRDLRVVDNTSLNILSKVCKNIYTIFIFTPEQVGQSNKYKSNNSVIFMINSLEELSQQIKKQGGHLYTFYGDNNDIIQKCIRYFNIDVVSFNIDITPYAKKRDSDIQKLCNKMNIHLLCNHDYYLHEPGTIKTTTGVPYQKFTPYYESARKIKVQSPAGIRRLPLKKISTSSFHETISLDQARNLFTEPNTEILVHGGRQEALTLLQRAAKKIKHYDATHNSLNMKTSELSASIKFGCLSIREVYKNLNHITGLIRQLYWRDFYANILYEFPRVIGHSLKEKYDRIRWPNNKTWFKKWCEGKTGFPIVDAGMRQMNQTGYMHNRARLIVASFLVKTLLIDWRYGERYFARTLTDYDVANNNGNWQWISGGGADSQPYFRVFNPWMQAREHDPDCSYIKTWVPELQEVPNKDVFNWDTEWSNYKNVKYPKPIVDYEEQRENIMKLYHGVFR
jgi:deoxyribodipyrimidine photo-lyase